MKIDTFKVERWMNEYEDDAVYNLAETCIDSLTLDELFKLAGIDGDEFLLSLKDKKMTYGDIFGSTAFKDGVASLYEDLSLIHI